MATKARVPVPAGYDNDVAGWAWSQAALLRERRLDLLDLDNIAEEIEGVARYERDKLISAIRVAQVHLLKWDHQPARRSRSWMLSVREQRLAVDERLRDNPSLRAQLAEWISRAYRKARIKAAKEMRVDDRTLPETCPYGFDDIMTRPIEWDGETA